MDSLLRDANKKISELETRIEQLEYILKRIANYDTPDELRENDMGIDFDEALEMAYENVIGEAEAAFLHQRTGG